MSKAVFVRVKVSAPWACFTRPEMKVERVSYEVMTPSAARGVLEAILWKPQMRWIVSRISVLRPIRFQAIRRNELQSKLAPGKVRKWIEDPTAFEPHFAGAGSDDATPRNTLALKDVAYLIEAVPHVYRPTSADTPTKYMAMFYDRVKKGQCAHRPYLGCREFAAQFEMPGAEKPIPEDRELGRMLYDIVYRDEMRKPVFFDAVLRKGDLDTRPEQVLKDPAVREEVLACSSAS